MAGRAELIEALREQEGLSREMSRRMVDGLFHAMEELLEAGEEIQIRGFGTFKEVARAPRQVRNPKTREMMDVPGSRVIKFRSRKK